MYVKVTEVYEHYVKFDNGFILSYEHAQQCCEEHYLTFENLKLEDFDNLEFDISNEGFFEKIDDFGIALLPLNGHPVRVPGYGRNNGCYSSELILTLENEKGEIVKSFDITDCQEIDE